MLKARFIKRYKRFFSDVEIDGNVFQAHVPNTGSLKSCLFPDSPCLLTPSTNPLRKLPYTLSAIQVPTGSWVGIEAVKANQLVRNAFEQNRIERWREFEIIKNEVKINEHSRLDFLLHNANLKRKHFVEVKSVTYASGDVANNNGVAQFPDAVTIRGQKHLLDLMELHQPEKGITCEIFYVIQRTDCKTFAPAVEIDPTYAQLLKAAREKGVWIYAHSISFDEVTFHSQLLKGSIS